MAALDGALALAHGHDAAMVVRHDLHFDVAGVLEEFLDIHTAIAEGGFRFGLRDLDGFLERRFIVGDAHALTAAAEGGLDKNGIADFFRDGARLIGVGQQAFRTRHRGYTGGLYFLPALGLIATQGDGLRRRADEADIAIAADGRELGILGEESIARVHGVGIANLGRGDDGRNIEITLRRRGRADADAFVGEGRMQ